MPTSTVTVGAATPLKLLDALKGVIAGASKVYAGLITANGCQYLRIEPATGITEIGEDSTVSATNRGATIDAAAAPADKYERESANGYNGIPLGQVWLFSTAGSTVNVTWQYA